MLAIGGMVLNDTILFTDNRGNKTCWELIGNTSTLNQYLGIYENTYQSETNYFATIDGEIYNCEKCLEKIKSFIGVDTKCKLDFVHSNRCKGKGIGKVYINGVGVYSWNNELLTNYNTSFDIANGDTITIVVTEIETGYSLTQDIRTYDGEGNENNTTDIINGPTSYEYSYKVNCGKENNGLSLINNCK
jgi:hypothetical protein